MVGTDLARGLDEAEGASFAAALAGEAPAPWPLRFLRPGPASGPVLGGCLSLLAAVAGTPWAPSLEGALLFVEDVNEPAYRIDRMLTHLRLSGTLSSVRAIVAGHFGGEWESGIAHAGPAAAWHRESLLALPGPAMPVAFGLPCGHGRPNLTLPLGAHARLDPLAGTLSFDLD
jgi:muramoyltetrapeptide carboxypeptidase